MVSLQHGSILFQEFLRSGSSRPINLTGGRGPLIFCLLLSMCLSFRHGGDDSSLIFSGVFALVWIGEAIVTTQIKLLGGNMYVSFPPHSHSRA